MLLLVHLAAIYLLLSLKSTRERPTEGLVTFMLSALARTVPHDLHARPAAPRRRAVPAPIRVEPPAPAPALIQETPATPTDAPAAPAPAGTVDTNPGKPAPLDLAIPKEFFDREREHERHLDPAEEAMRDPRSNRLVLTKQEQIEIDFGQIECIAWQREPDGSMYRGPGHLKKVLNIPMGGKTIFECVK